MLSKVLNIFNIKADSNQKFILISLFLSTLLMTYASPRITKAIVTDMPVEWLAFQSLFMSICTLVIGMMWRGKIRKTVLNYFMLLCITESLAGFFLGMYLCFIKYNVWVFAICSLIYTAFITNLVGKCIMAFKAKMWNEKEREIYDNNISIVAGIVCIIGFAMALIIMPSLKVALFLWGICCIIDDIGWIVVYYNNKKSLKEV